MSLLKRPDTVDFDPANKEHRLAVHAFMRRKAWMDSPLKFSHDPTYGSVADQVQAKLLRWYADQEEAREARRAAKKSSRPAAPPQGNKDPVAAGLLNEWPASLRRVV